MDIGDFERGYAFALDDFQRRANAALAADRSVLVCAPTGAGKTVVGEFGVWLALQRGGKAFYTTPLKALSNQKFGDFIARYGASKVGLLTGDNSINGEAPIVVMTTEVLRNMLYEDSPTLNGLRIVVMDEVHYLRDQYRGATWEEILIHLPQHVRVAALSATVSNADEFGGWLRSVRGDTDVVVETRRPVPIEHLYMVGKRLHPLFVESDGRRELNQQLKRLNMPDERGRARGRRPKILRADRIEVVDRLYEDGLLPAIVFIFSRAGCEQAVAMMRAGGVRLTDADERERIREYVEMRTSALPPGDHAVLGYDEWALSLQDGVASHHAGMIPLFKETVEELFERGLVKVVFATETLSLGINMPARSVVIERLVKFTGERHELMSDADYTQLTGRAGRRGMDDVGFGITLLHADIAIERIVALAQGTTFPLQSSFRPSYNMAVNLLQIHSVPEAKRLLNLSFAQYTADRSVGKQDSQIKRNERFLEGYAANVVCDRGDFTDYWAIAKQVRASERDEVDEYRRNRARTVRAAFEALRPGQVVGVRKGPRRGLVAVVDIRRTKNGEPQPVVLTADRRLSRLAIRDFPEPPVVVGTITIPRGDPRAPRVRQEVARQLARLEPAEEHEGAPARRARVDHHLAEAMRAHPVYACPDRDEHERWMMRIEELEAETEALRKRVRRRTETLARIFERVLDVLGRYGYVEDGTVTDKGRRLARIYNESDLLIAEAIADGLFDDLDAAEVAALASMVVYETRIGAPDEYMPTQALGRAFGRLKRLYRQIHISEDDAQLELVREPDPGFAAQMHRWASGDDLEDVLDMGDLSAGDFVRSTKQVWDLLRQLAELEVSPDLVARCRDAAHAIYRGVVAYSGAL